jgi:dipeptidase
LNSPELEVIYAHDAIEFARNKGLYTGKDSDFSFSDVYAPLDFGGARFCEVRVWSFFKSVNKEMVKYLDYASGDIRYDESFADGSKNPNHFPTNRMPLWIKPEQKISVHDMMNFMRDHLEGTPLDMTADIGAGPYEKPYRWRPLTWMVDSITYCNERATATQQTGFSFVAQMRSWLPDVVGGIFWFEVDDASSSVYMPMYSCMTRVPEKMAVGYGSMMEFVDDAAFWVFNQISNLAYTRYNLIHPEIAEKQQATEKGFIEETAAIDQVALKLNEADPARAVEFLTNYSVNLGNQTVMEWKQFYGYLFTRFMDGNVKTKVDVPAGYKYIPPKVEQPGYPEEWLRKIAETTGDKLKVKGSAH